MPTNKYIEKNKIRISLYCFANPNDDHLLMLKPLGERQLCNQECSPGLKLSNYHPIDNPPITKGKGELQSWGRQIHGHSLNQMIKLVSLTHAIIKMMP